MHDNKSIIRSAGGDDEASDRELTQYQDAWKKMGQVGNLPLAILLDIAVRNQKKEKPAPFGHTEKAKAKIGRPKGAKNLPKKELVATDG